MTFEELPLLIVTNAQRGPIFTRGFEELYGKTVSLFLLCFYPWHDYPPPKKYTTRE